MEKSRKTNVVVLDRKRRESSKQMLDQLYSEHGAALRAFLRMRMGPGEDYEDLVQEVFARLADMADLNSRLPPGDERNRAFIFTVANNLMVDIKRRQAVRHKYLQEQTWMSAEYGQGGVSTETVALAREELERLKSVIMALRPKWRDSFILTRFMHKSYSDAAKEMGVSVRQIRRYVTKALVEIRKAGIGTEGVG